MFLDKIVAKKKEEVEQLHSQYSQAQFEDIIANLSPCRGFHQALTEKRNRTMGLIAEVKKASPSKGLIREVFDPQAIAKAYVAAGADCISVLTDAPFFQGTIENLKQVRQVVDVPLLRKDFTIDALQIYEARAIGADAILLIAAILSKEEIKQFLHIAEDLGLDALVEVHDEHELDTVLALDAKLIGINNRNLKTFETSLTVTERLIDRITKEDVTVVSESGISETAQISTLTEMGAGAVLVGEHFMRQENIQGAVNALMGELSE